MGDVGPVGAPTRGAVRAAGALALGVATLAVAAGAHVSAGGALPSTPILALLALPLAVAAMAMTHRRCGRVLLVASLALVQTLLHEILVVLTVHAPTLQSDLLPPGRVPSDKLPSDMAAHLSGTSASAMGSLGQAPGGAVAMTTMNVLAIHVVVMHAIAAVVTALLLARGQQALWQLVSRLLPALPRILLVHPCEPRRAHLLPGLPTFRPSLVSSGSGLRGPPVRVPATA